MQKLEPWSVGGVRVAGGLNLLSALAKALPVSEDQTLVVDEHLIAPSISKKRLVMLIGVSSTGNNFERRMAIRRSWMQYKAVRSGEVAVRFLIGLVSYELEPNSQFLVSKNTRTAYQHVVKRNIVCNSARLGPTVYRLSLIPLEVSFV